MMIDTYIAVPDHVTISPISFLGRYKSGHTRAQGHRVNDSMNARDGFRTPQKSSSA